MNKHYFLSYVFLEPFGFGSTEVWREDPITGFDDIESVTKLLEEKYGKKIVILNWRRFEEVE